MIHREYIVAQHKLVVVDFFFHARVLRDKIVKIRRIKWWKLKGKEQWIFKERMIAEEPWYKEGDADNMWVNILFCIWKVAGRCLG